MARLIWTEPALQDLEAIADYIALDKPDAAKKLVRRIFSKVEKLQKFPRIAFASTSLARIPTPRARLL